MISRIEVFFRSLRRSLSRSELAVRLLRLAPAADGITEPGLILIQLDGLSHPQLRRALDQGKMPFLKRLLMREHYRLHPLYSGVPSTTPAIQAELFYGVRQAVPCFSFLHRQSGQVFRMYEPAAAATIEKELASQGRPLLAGGSAYADIFTGGAAESHFCPASLGWGGLLQAANPFALLFLLCTNIFSLLRTMVLLGLEFMLALTDFCRGIIAGHDLGKELKFIPTRVGICILLRELITIGVKMDIARGLPIIHLNFVGYDEQAHRRGPSSLFAHWALKGIDDAIARIWRATRRAARREYDLWIYSDHGQEAATTYLQQQGRSLQEAVTEVLARETASLASVAGGSQAGEQAQRVRLLGGKRIQRLFATERRNETHAFPEGGPLVTALGPVGLIYLPLDQDRNARSSLARRLVAEADIPMVLLRETGGRARVFTAAGEFVLPEEREEVFGPYHPFLEEVGRDLAALCHHPNAGELVTVGWRKNAAAVSFSIENGAHGGPGPQETKGFALLPPDVPLAGKEQPYLRTLDLRAAAFQAMGLPEYRKRATVTRPKPRQTLRVMTYNVHSCIGLDGKMSPERIARVIAQHGADVIALQELDVGRKRTDGVDQAHRIARYLQMDCQFHATVQVAGELYGNAILTHLPMRLMRAGSLPGLAKKPHLELRGAIWVSIRLDGIELQCITTHLGLRPAERWQQVTDLLGAEWLMHPDCRRPVVLCGDFNAAPSSPVCLRIRDFLQDAQIEAAGHFPRRTFYGRYPLARIDHLFVDPGTRIAGIEVPATALARVASDHLPLIAEICLPS